MMMNTEIKTMTEKEKTVMRFACSNAVERELGKTAGLLMERAEADCYGALFTADDLLILAIIRNPDEPEVQVDLSLAKFLE